MPRYIMKIHDDKDDTDYYLEWSTVVDAPITEGMPLDEFKKYYRYTYGERGIPELSDRLKRVEKFGVSAHPPFNDLEDYFSFNRAGEKESTLNKEGILNKYCRNQPEATSK